MTIDKSTLINRLKEAYNIKTDNDLAKQLSIAATTVSSWRRRNSLDFDIIHANCKGINWNYLIYGIGPYFIQCEEQDDKSDCPPKEASLSSETDLLRSLAERNDQLVGILIQEINRLKTELDRIGGTTELRSNE